MAVGSTEDLDRPEQGGDRSDEPFNLDTSPMDDEMINSEGEASFPGVTLYASTPDIRTSDVSANEIEDILGDEGTAPVVTDPTENEKDWNTVTRKSGNESESDKEWKTGGQERNSQP
jgi:hypothetical protein